MKDIPGYEELYAVTAEGAVWSHSAGKWLKLQSSDKAGHLTVTLSKKGKSKTWGVHQLVLLTYVGPCPSGLEACHENGVSNDNRLTNLRYDTHSANMLQSAQDNSHKIARGERVNTCKLNEDKVREIRSRFHRKEAIKTMAKEYGLSATAIGNIVHGKTWKHVQGG